MDIKKVREMIKRVEEKEKTLKENLEGFMPEEELMFEIGVDSSMSDEDIKEMIENNDERLERLKDINSALDEVEEVGEEVKKEMKKFNKVREALKSLEEENKKMEKITGKEKFFDFGINNDMSNSEIEKLIQEDDESIHLLMHWYNRHKEENKKKKIKKYGKIAAIGVAALISGILVGRGN